MCYHKCAERKFKSIDLDNQRTYNGFQAEVFFDTDLNMNRLAIVRDEWDKKFINKIKNKT